MKFQNVIYWIEQRYSYWNKYYSQLIVFMWMVSILFRLTIIVEVRITYLFCFFFCINQSLAMLLIINIKLCSQALLNPTCYAFNEQNYSDYSRIYSYSYDFDTSSRIVIRLTIKPVSTIVSNIVILIVCFLFSWWNIIVYVIEL